MTRCKAMQATLIALAIVGTATLGPNRGHAQSTFPFGSYGQIRLFEPKGTPTRVVLLLSGDGGWSPGVGVMATTIAEEGAVVAGVDMRSARKAMEASAERCAYPAADLEQLSRYLQKRLKLPTYHPPVLVGYSGGASLAYAALAEAPDNTFAGAISLGFCPDLILRKPLCAGDGPPAEPVKPGGPLRLKPAPRLAQPWIALHGTDDQACPLPINAEFIKQVPGARLVRLPGVGHGFSHPAQWTDQLRSALRSISEPAEATQRPQAPAVHDLPLIEVPVQGPSRNFLAVVLSGDGGWASIDRQLGQSLSTHGVPVVGFNSLRYYWTPRTPDGAAADLERVLRHYMDTWHKDRAILVGYSHGADVLPFLASRLPEDLRRRVALVALLGVGPRATFEFRVTDWLPTTEVAGPPTVPEIRKLTWTRVLCVYGNEDETNVCTRLPAGTAKLIATPGGHHFGGDYDAIASDILANIP